MPMSRLFDKYNFSGLGFEISGIVSNVGVTL